MYVKSILTAVGYEMLHDELLFFTIEIENKKVIFQQHNALMSNYKKVTPRFQNKIITITNIEY